MKRSFYLLTVICCAHAIPAVGAIDIQFDYTFDSSNFFNGNPQRQNVLNAAAQVFESRFTDNLTAITPDFGANNTWTATFSNPSTGSIQGIENLIIGNGVIIVYAGARDLPGDTVGLGGPGGFSVGGSAAFVNSVALRGQTGASDPNPTDFGPWGGSITFDALTAWHFDQDITTIESFPSITDFYSVALHELAHLLGIGTADSWYTYVGSTTDTFHGPKSIALNGGVPVPLDSGIDHWADGTTSNVLSPVVLNLQETAMDPVFFEGTRKYFTELDFAGLDDIGWTVIPEPATGFLFAGGTALIAARRRRLKAD